MAGVRDAWRTPGIRRREIAAGGKTRAREVCTGIGSPSSRLADNREQQR